MEETQIRKEPSPYLVPAAIVIAGAFIAGAVIFTSPNSKAVAVKGADNNPAQETDTTNKIRAVSETEHIKGDFNAPIKIVTYSDFECPFCQRFHNTMRSLMEKHKESGDVVWVFRQFPLEELHPVKAKAVAVASECANDQGGGDAFWKFTDRYFELTKTNNRTDIETVIPQIVKEVGLNEVEFNTCFGSDKFEAKIQADIDDAVATGGRGTPWSVLIAPNGKTFPINGALPISAIEQLIELAKKGE
mgnify:CR=1 FL=1